VATENKPAATPAKAETDAGRETSRKRKLVGVVTSDKMNKTRVVMVERRVSHGKYGKYLTKRTKFKAHDEKNDARIGDIVRIEETRPLSKEKRWRLVEILKRAEQTVAPEIVAAELEQSVGLTPQSDER
jgi:small subunit ribosomal protein S17